MNPSLPNGKSSKTDKCKPEGEKINGGGDSNEAEVSKWRAGLGILMKFIGSKELWYPHMM